MRGDKAAAGFQLLSRRHSHVAPAPSFSPPLSLSFSHGRFPSLDISPMPCAATSPPAHLAASYDVSSHPYAALSQTRIRLCQYLTSSYAVQCQGNPTNYISSPFSGLSPFLGSTYRLVSDSGLA